MPWHSFTQLQRQYDRPYILCELQRRHHPVSTERLVRLYENLPERPSERAIAIMNDTYIQAFIIFLTREVSPLPRWSRLSLLV